MAGLFSGLTSKNQHAGDMVDPWWSLLSPSLRPYGKDIGRGSIRFWDEQLNQGETPLERSLFSASRNASTQQYQNAVGNTQAQLHRSGLGSSGDADRSMAALNLGLGNIFAQQDAQRAAALLARRQQAAQMGLQNALTQAKSAVPVVHQPGLFEGLGTKVLGAGISGGLNALGGGIPGLLGGGSGLFGGLGSRVGAGLSDLGGSLFGFANGVDSSGRLR